MICGYINVQKNASNRELEEKRQAEILNHFGVDKIVVDNNGGEDFRFLIGQLESGDAIHVVSIDQIARSVSELKYILCHFQMKNIKLYEFGHEINPALLQIFLEYEVKQCDGCLEVIRKIQRSRKK